MEDNTLNTLLSDSEGILIRGERIVPLPFPFGKLPRVARSVSNLLDFALTMPTGLVDAIQSAAKSSDQSENTGIDTKALDPNLLTFFLGLMENSIEDVMALVSISTNKPVEWVESLNAVEGLELVVAVFSVNYDFFTQKFSAALNGLLNNVNKLQTTASEESQSQN